MLIVCSLARKLIVTKDVMPSPSQTNTLGYRTSGLTQWQAEPGWMFDSLAGPARPERAAANSDVAKLRHSCKCKPEINSAAAGAIFDSKSDFDDGPGYLGVRSLVT